MQNLSSACGVYIPAESTIQMIQNRTKTIRSDRQTSGCFIVDLVGLWLLYMYGWIVVTSPVHIRTSASSVWVRGQWCNNYEPVKRFHMGAEMSSI